MDSSKLYYLTTKGDSKTNWKGGSDCTEMEPVILFTAIRHDVMMQCDVMHSEAM